MPPTLWHNCFFLLFAAIACASAVAVVVTGNIVRMACYLVVSLAAVAGLFFLAGAEFLGAVQLMVYVGGTMVLLVFGVMLTARGPFVSMKISSGQWVVAVVVGGALLAVLLQAAFNFSVAGRVPRRRACRKSPPRRCRRCPRGERRNETEKLSATEQLGFSLFGVPVDRPQQQPVLSAATCWHLRSFRFTWSSCLVGAAYLARASGECNANRPRRKRHLIELITG